LSLLRYFLNWRGSFQLGGIWDLYQACPGR
jgi:hypothetical protein